ncbi:MAG: wax ester/triacylglycerol synthase family O-acyltransferase, partial [Anaerolineae bacterium]
MPPTVEPLSHVDAAWLGMEDPTNLMMVTGVLAFKAPLNFDQLRDTIKYRLLKFDRFKMKVMQPRMPLATPYWETDANFDLNAHLHRIALPSPADKSALEEVVSDLLSTPLDYTKPLWQIHYIENYGEGSAILCRLHHSIADGMALMFVLLSLTDMRPDAPWPQPDDSAAQPADDGVRGPLGALFKQASSAINTARNLTEKIVTEGLDALIAPAKAVDLALQGADHAVAASRLVLRSPDPQTIFKGKLGVRKKGAWTRPLPLRDIKAIRKVTGGTINDVLITAMTGALRRYMVGRGAPVDGLNFRAVVPVNIRKPEEMTQLGNKFGLVYLALPIGVEDTLERLQVVNERMTALKNSPEAVAAFGILKGIGMSPPDVQQNLVPMFGAKSTAVMTNVPGPPVPLYLAGSEISEIMFWVPQSGRVALGISILSYASKVFLGVATDVGLVPDPETIVDGFYEEYDDLMAMVADAKAAEGKPAAPPTQVQDDPDRCQSMTKNGRRCRNRSLDGSDYCRVH